MSTFTFSPLDGYWNPLPLHCMQTKWKVFFVLHSFVAPGLPCSTCAISVLKGGFRYSSWKMYYPLYHTRFYSLYRLVVLLCHRKAGHPLRGQLSISQVLSGHVLSLRCCSSFFSHLSALSSTLASVSTCND